MMNKQYVIQWKSRVNGRAGKGTKLFARQEAEKLAAELNREYPDIEHMIMDTDQEGRSFAQTVEGNPGSEPIEDTSEAESRFPQVLSLQE
jgi:hypothetical protein